MEYQTRWDEPSSPCAVGGGEDVTNAAFATQTLPGVIPILGGIGIVGVSAFRAFMAGVVNYYVLGVSIGFAVLGIGTSLLELTAYIFSASAGINISLSVIFPRRYGVEGRWTAFKMAWKDAGRLYVIVIILLALGAIWEVGGAALGRG